MTTGNTAAYTFSYHNQTAMTLGAGMPREHDLVIVLPAVAHKDPYRLSQFMSAVYDIHSDDGGRGKRLAISADPEPLPRESEDSGIISSSFG